MWSFGSASGKEPTYHCRRCKRREFDLWVRKIPWRRKWQPTLIFLPGESHGQRSLVSYSPWCHRESDTTEMIYTQATTIIQWLYLMLWSDSVQFSHSGMYDCLWPHGRQPARPPCPSPTPGLLRLMSIETVMPSNLLILCRPLLLLPSIFPSIRVFSNDSDLHIRWPKYWSFSFSISPSNEYSWLVSFWMDWLDFLAAQGTLNSLLQHRSSKFFGAQLSLESNSHIHTRVLEKPQLWLDRPLLVK